MFKYLLRNGPKLCFLPFFKEYLAHDRLEQITDTERNVDTSLSPPETGRDRIKRMFEVDDLGGMSYELNSIIQCGCMSLFIGGIYGGVMSSKGAYLEFMRNNEASKFKSHLDAKRKLQDAVTIAFGKGAFRWAWRLSLFSCSFLGISTLIQTYRGKCSVGEYVAAGGVSGALYKFNMGPRGWIVGGGLGSVLGLIGGITTMGLLKLGGFSIEEARYWQSQWKHSRKEYVRKGMAEYLEKEDFAVIKLHNDKVGEAGRDINNLDNDVNNVNKTTN